MDDNEIVYYCATCERTSFGATWFPTKRESTQWPVEQNPYCSICTIKEIDLHDPVPSNLTAWAGVAYTMNRVRKKEWMIHKAEEITFGELKKRMVVSE